LQHGQFPAIMGTDESLLPAKVVDRMRGDEPVPFLYVMHGTEDSAVPCTDSVKFVAAWKAKFGDASAVAKFEKGDHGFDGEASLETPWMKEALVKVTQAWLGEDVQR